MSLTLEHIIFYLFAALAVISALLILFTRNVLYAAFLLIITFMSISAVYVFAGADFIAITQILVYVGGVLVLMIFGVMLTNKISGQAVTAAAQYPVWAVLIGFALFGLLLISILQVNYSSLAWIEQAVQQNELIRQSTIQPLGIRLMTDYVLPFELAGILLLVALIGAAYIAKRQMD